MSEFKKSIRSVRAGFSLVEVTMALGIISMCLITLFGLIPVGMSSNRTSVDQGAAANIARMIVADLRSPAKRTSPNLASPGISPLYGINIPAATGSGSESFFLDSAGKKKNSAADATYKAKLEFSAAVSETSSVRVLITWPPAAQNPTNSYEVVTVLDRRN